MARDSVVVSTPAWLAGTLGQCTASVGNCELVVIQRLR